MSYAASGALIAILMILFVFLMAYAAVLYILESLGLQTIARRRGIEKPWLAWIPGGSGWILGSISDQYCYVTTGQINNRRKKLMILQIVYLTVNMVYSFFTGLINGFNAIGATGVSQGIRILSVIFLIVGIGMLAMSIIYTVQSMMALHHLYRSCNPPMSVVFLMLSIFVVPGGFFVYALRNRDDGMPPRHTAEPVLPEPTIRYYQ